MVAITIVFHWGLGSKQVLRDSMQQQSLPKNERNHLRQERLESWILMGRNQEKMLRSEEWWAFLNQVLMKIEET